ncbi:coenzyme F420-0:L-glutamate ligase [Microbacterium gorillae]|uniref:coenzyme F420-0:L-glutamate ligase n=1 Tax=Microbacterium gorillae TaxID=1231063 RepID=UPI00058B1C48|nr:coenzyme F420-0:L-glutamate ligase [Microbacterium gorillae]
MAEANPNKHLEITVDGVAYQRIPIKTRVVMPDDDLNAFVTEYVPAGTLRDGDILFVTEKIVGITQGRSYLVEDIHPRKLAYFLSKYVTRTPYGIGLGMPETMEMALRECGTPKILLAAAVAAVTKAFGRKGDFYRIAGPKARAIDGPTKGTIPPYNKSVVLGPDRPEGVAKDLRSLLSTTADIAVVDINDLGGNILGSTLSKAEEDRLVRILKDNPLGQGHESTPMGIIRRA